MSTYRFVVKVRKTGRYVWRFDCPACGAWSSSSSVRKAMRRAYHRAVDHAATCEALHWANLAAYDRHLAVAVLEAVADDLRAAALEDMADELHRLDDGRTGGYYDAGRHIIARLRDRAAKLRGADQ